MLSYIQVLHKKAEFFPGATLGTQRSTSGPPVEPQSASEAYESFVYGGQGYKDKYKDEWKQGFVEGLKDAPKEQGKAVWRQFDSRVTDLAGLSAPIGKLWVRTTLSPLLLSKHTRNYVDKGERFVDRFWGGIQNKVHDWNNTVQNSDLYKTNLSDTDKIIASISTVPLMVAGDWALLPKFLSDGSKPLSQLSKMDKTLQALEGFNIPAALPTEETPATDDNAIPLEQQELVDKIVGFDELAKSNEYPQETRQQASELRDELLNEYWSEMLGIPLPNTAESATVGNEQTEATVTKTKSTTRPAKKYTDLTPYFASGAAGLAGLLGTSYLTDKSKWLKRHRLIKRLVNLAGAGAMGYAAWRLANGDKTGG